MPMPLSGLALTLSQSVKDIQNQIVDVQSQLASGQKTLNPAENGVVTRLSAQADAYGKVENNISNANNVIGVAQTALQSIADILTQMKSLATQATSAGLTTDDTSSLNQTFAALATQVANLGTGASVNGNNLLANSTGIAVTTGIDGASASQTTVAGVNVATIATTAAALSITQGNTGTSLVAKTAAGTDNVVAGVDATAGTASVDTFNVGTAAHLTASTASTVKISTGTGYVQITGGSATSATAAELADALAAFITYGTNAGGVGNLIDYTISDNSSAQSAMAARFDVTSSSGVLTFTQKAGSTRQATSGLVATGSTSTASVVTNTQAGAAYSAGTAAIDKVTFSTLTNGQSITVGGLTFTAGASGAADSAIATAFYNFMTNGTQPATSVGTFTGNTYATMNSLYTVGNTYNGTATPTSSYLYIKARNTGSTVLSATTGSSVENARNAISSLTTLINTVSTGQAGLSASKAGLVATLSATQALKSGLQNTVDTIQNIDATAMQAKLQQLNNQQSIDYYLVSQMNTEAAAILSIFR
ncbi:hypothetical protein [Polynucleobacter sp. JS-JIR-5-A7]|uniref:flagellin N-terminal helical domain-containing protein n=1 Tax=Polynucleobacter sp. JS-JIR-5-A7 TaxID=1758395 RepID=UPI001BFD7B5E|nr:hypothetical protein [Polynucleobacter sp. JS-JIR-5-A7]QWE07376.1 hypothetical protein AOC29_04060 [Polynucleobacter sp. JS-JIR-5-A7]